MDSFLACQERFRRRERAMQRMVDDVRWLMEQHVEGESERFNRPHR